MGCVPSSVSSDALYTPKVYKDGLAPVEYFHARLYPKQRTVLDGLNLDEQLSWAMFTTFLRADADWSGSLSLEETTVFFGLRQTRFVERLFALFDTDGSGELDFMEFTAGVWNVSTMDDKSIARFCFSLVGSEEDEEIEREIESEGGALSGIAEEWSGFKEPAPLTLPQCDALYRMLTEVSTQQPQTTMSRALAQAGFGAEPESGNDRSEEDKALVRARRVHDIVATDKPIGAEQLLLRLRSAAALDRATSSGALGAPETQAEPTSTGTGLQSSILNEDAVSLVGSEVSKDSQGSIGSVDSATLEAWTWKGCRAKAARQLSCDSGSLDATSQEMHARILPAVRGFPAQKPGQCPSAKVVPSTTMQPEHDADDADWWSGSAALAEFQAALPGHAMIGEKDLRRLYSQRDRALQPCPQREGKDKEVLHVDVVGSESAEANPPDVVTQATTPGNSKVDDGCGIEQLKEESLSPQRTRGGPSTLLPESLRPVASPTVAGTTGVVDDLPAVSASRESIPAAMTAPDEQRIPSDADGGNDQTEERAEPSLKGRDSVQRDSSPAGPRSKSDLEELYSHLHPAVVAADADLSGSIDFGEFTEMLRTNPELLGAATAVRTALQTQCLNPRTWRQLMRWRNDRFPPGASVEYIMNVHQREEVAAMTAYVQQRKAEEEVLRQEVEAGKQANRGDKAKERWERMGRAERNVQEASLVLAALVQEAEQQHAACIGDGELKEPDDLFLCPQFQAALRRVEVYLLECIRLVPASVEERRAAQATKLPARAMRVAMSRREQSADVRARIGTAAYSRLREYRDLVKYGGTGHSAILKESFKATEGQGLQAAAMYQIMMEHSREVEDELEESEAARWYGVLHTEVKEFRDYLDDLFSAFGIDESGVDRYLWRRDWDSDASAYTYTCIARDAAGQVVRVEGVRGSGDEPRRVVRGRLPEPGDERFAEILGKESVTFGYRCRTPKPASGGALALRGASKAHLAASEGWKFALPGAAGYGPEAAGRAETKHDIDRVVADYFDSGTRHDAAARADGDLAQAKESAWEEALPASFKARKAKAALVSLEKHKAKQRILAKAAEDRTVGKLC